jgi:hypothetical protein
MHVCVTSRAGLTAALLLLVAAGCQPAPEAAAPQTPPPAPQTAAVSGVSPNPSPIAAGGACIEPGLYKGRVMQSVKEVLIASVAPDCRMTGTLTNHPSDAGRLRGATASHDQFTTNPGPQGLPEIRLPNGIRYADMRPCGRNLCLTYCNRDATLGFTESRLSFVCDLPFELARE